MSIGRNQTKTKQVYVHQSRYKITVGGDTSYRQGSPIEVTVSLFSLLCFNKSC